MLVVAIAVLALERVNTIMFALSMSSLLVLYVVLIQIA